MPKRIETAPIADQSCAAKSKVKIEVICILLLLVVGSLMYSNSLKTPFVFDDINSITKNNPHVHMTELSWDQVKRAALKSRLKTRILPNISLALNYYVGEEETFGYHLVNLMIHLLNATFLFVFIMATFRIPVVARQFQPPKTKGEQSPELIILLAFFSTLLWMSHPIQTNAVTYTCQRMASMAALFYLLSLLSYVSARMAVKGKQRLKAVTGFSGCVFFGFVRHCQ